MSLSTMSINVLLLNREVSGDGVWWVNRLIGLTKEIVRGCVKKVIKRFN